MVYALHGHNKAWYGLKVGKVRLSSLYLPSAAGFFGGLKNINPVVLEAAVHGSDTPVVATEYSSELQPPQTLIDSNYFVARRTDKEEIEVWFTKTLQPRYFSL